jgi:hypothetical protein
VTVEGMFGRNGVVRRNVECACNILHRFQICLLRYASQTRDDDDDAGLFEIDLIISVLCILLAYDMIVHLGL